MPSKSPKQAKLMSAIAHGWHAPMENAPPMAVAREFHAADKREGEYMHAEGGYISPADSPKSKLLGALASAARWAGGPVNGDARAHLLAGLASQVYGLGADGSLKLGGGSINEAPGAVDELLAIPAEFVGHHAPQASIEANEHVARLRNKIFSDMGLHDPRGFTQQMASAAGTMFGQVPVPGGALTRAISGAMQDAPRAISRTARVLAPAAEWMSPTIHPTAGNYLSGTLFGGLAGGGTDALTDHAPPHQDPGETPLNKPNFAMGGLAAIANSGLGGGTMRSLSIGHPSTMREIIHPHLMMNPRTPGGGIVMPHVKFAEGGKVGGLQAALHALSQMFQGHAPLHEDTTAMLHGLDAVQGVPPEQREAINMHNLMMNHGDAPDQAGAHEALLNHLAETYLNPDVTKKAAGGPVELGAPQSMPALAGPAGQDSWYTYGKPADPMQQQISPSTLQGMPEYPQGSPQAQRLGNVGMQGMPPSALNNPAIRQLLMNLSRGAPRSRIPAQVLFPGAGAR